MNDRAMLDKIEVTQARKLLDTITKEERILLVSDGGLKNKGAFGWVLATENEILTKGRGPTRGEKNQMSSFRPEATGMY